MPLNDNFADAEILILPLGIPVTRTGDTTGATTETGEQRPSAAPIGATIWYRFTPAVDAAVTIDAAGSTFDTVLAVWTGDTLETLIEQASNDDFGGTAQSRIGPLNVTAGTTYSIQFGSYGSGSSGGAFTLTFTLIPPPPPFTIPCDHFQSYAGDLAALRDVYYVQTPNPLILIDGQWVCELGGRFATGDLMAYPANAESGSGESHNIFDVMAVLSYSQPQTAGDWAGGPGHSFFADKSLFNWLTSNGDYNQDYVTISGTHSTGGWNVGIVTHRDGLKWMTPPGSFPGDGSIHTLRVRCDTVAGTAQIWIDGTLQLDVGGLLYEPVPIGGTEIGSNGSGYSWVRFFQLGDCLEPVVALPSVWFQIVG